MPEDKKRSCLDCPSYLHPGRSVAVFGKSTGAAMCQQFGHVLSRPLADPDRNELTARMMASKCSKYGQPPAGTPDSPMFEVVLPDPVAREKVLSDLDINKKRVTSCATCVNFVPDEIVARDLGWTAGLCAAKGRLILPSKKVAEARGCDYRKFGQPRRSIDGLPLMPAFADTSTLSIDLVAEFDTKPKLIEPHEYETDAPVTDEDIAEGIRAWRKITDPEGTGNYVLLPIYELERLKPEERALVPKTGDDEHPELYRDHGGVIYKIAVLWRELDETPTAWGQPGVGKTEIFRHLAWMMCLPFYRFSITGSTELDDLAGKMLFDPDQGTHFQYGRLSAAWSKPCIIVLDEPNTGPPEVWEFLRPLTDNSKQLILDTNKGEPIKRDENCYLGMAMNPAWDPKNVGTSVIGAADASRLMHIYFDLPPEKIEREIIADRVALDGWRIDKARLDFVMKVAAKVRQLCQDEALTMSWGIREQIKVSRALRWFAPLTAYRMAIGDMLDPQQQQILLDQVRSESGTAHAFTKVTPL